MKLYFLKFSLLITFFASSNLFFAQEVQFQTGKKAEMDGDINTKSIFPLENGGAIALLGKPRVFKTPDNQLEVVDDKMNVVSKNKIQLQGQSWIPKMEVIKDEIFLFIAEYDNSNNEETLSGVRLSKDGKFEGEPRTIAQFKVSNKLDLYSFTINASSDSSMFLIYSKLAAKDASIYGIKIKKNVKVNKTFFIINRDFDVVSKKKVEFPFKLHDFFLRQALLDASGNIHILAQEFIKQPHSLFKTNIPVEDYHLYTLYRGENDLHEYPIQHIVKEAKYISEMRLKADDQGVIECSGFYSDEESNSATGVVFFTINTKDRDISNLNSQRFSDKFINKFLTEKELKKKERKNGSKNNPYTRFNNYKIRDMVMKKGGGFYLVAEYYEVIVGPKSTSYRYKDLIVINILKDNSIEWLKRIAKSQYSANSYILGVFTGLNKDNSLAILYNGAKANLGIISDGEPEKTGVRHSFLVLVDVNEDGTATKKLLMDQDKSGVHLIPDKCYTDNNGDFLLFSKKYRDVLFSHLTIN